MADGLEVGGPGGVLGACLAVGVVELDGKGSVIHLGDLANILELEAVNYIQDVGDMREKVLGLGIGEAVGDNLTYVDKMTLTKDIM